MGFAVLFPGQGSQSVGMGASLFHARPDLLGDAADEALGWSLASVCLEGPEDRLTATEHAQPALFALSYTLWDELARALGDLRPAAAAGHSLGEYTALAAAGALGYLEALRLVAARGRAMADAARRQPSGMAALIGAAAGAAERMCDDRRAEGGRLWVANRNAPGQVVIAGGAEDIAWAGEQGRAYGIRRVVPLQVAGAFHSPFMEPAAAALRGALEAATFAGTGFPVWANTTARPYEGDPATTLHAQLTEPVRFEDSLVDMGRAGVTRFVHVGPGDVTAGLARRSVEGAETLVVSGIEDVAAAARLLERGA